jgi:alkyl hydroperoxide reductase subunit AhpF
VDTPVTAGYFTHRDRRTLDAVFRRFRRPVTIHGFFDEGQSATLRNMLQELAVLAGGHLLYQEITDDGHPLARVLGVTDRPTLRFYTRDWAWAPVEMVGDPSGYQFGVLLGILASLAGGFRPRIHGRLVSSVRNLNREVILEVLTLPTCPHSPHVVRITQEFALTNPGRVMARSISVTDYPVSMSLGVEAVPHLRVLSHGQLLATYTGILSPEALWQLIERGIKGGH